MALSVALRGCSTGGLAVEFLLEAAGVYRLMSSPFLREPGHRPYAAIGAYYFRRRWAARFAPCGPRSLFGGFRPVQGAVDRWPGHIEEFG